MIAPFYLSSNSEAGYYLMRLLSWKVLSSEWIARLVIAYSAVTVTLVVVARVIGFPRFATIVSELLVRLKENAHLMAISVVPFGRGFFASCTAFVKPSLLACTANTGLVQRSVTVAAKSLTTSLDYPL